ncbi:MAG: serine protease [Myxococcota bacterium]
MNFETRSSEIVGGTNTNISQVPWQVSVQWRSSGSHFCGGSILSPTWILTAAHCVDNKTAGAIRVEAGATRLTDNGQVQNVSRIIVHRFYNGNTDDGNDIALLQLQGSLNLSGNNARAIRVATADDWPFYEVGDDMLISGWGRLSSGGTSPNHLQSAVVPVISNAAAAAAYGAHRVTPDQIAAGFLGVGGVDACQGDSGGPMAADLFTESLLVGVVSWGIGCAEAQHPGMYARVPSFANWVYSQTGLSDLPTFNVSNSRDDEDVTIRWDAVPGADFYVLSTEEYDCYRVRISPSYSRELKRRYQWPIRIKAMTGTYSSSCNFGNNTRVIAASDWYVVR